jgi:RNA polymerase sigma-70 factor (ECF subfamily)
MKSRADAEDVVQESCLRAFRSFGSFNGGQPRAWLLAIVRNTAFSWLESNRARRIVSIEALGDAERNKVESEWADATTPETAFIEKADAAMLEAAIRSLPVEFRETLVLRDIHGFDYREIAQITSAPIGTVISRLSRARRHLLRSFAPAGDAFAEADPRALDHESRREPRTMKLDKA